jgi:D-lactate dehydrogenase (cytochrome)
MERLSTQLISQEKDCLIDHGYSQWSYHEAQALPGCVIYPRSTQDVVKLVKLAALHSIPLVPYSGGTSLEGHFHAFVSVNEPKVEDRVPINELPPGLGWSLDFTEMGEIIKINAGDLDIVVQPGVSYDAINATLREQNIPLFFPVDPAPGAMIGTFLLV